MEVIRTFTGQSSLLNGLENRRSRVTGPPIPQVSVRWFVIAAPCRVAYHPDKPIDQYKKKLTGGALSSTAKPGEKL
jgi:hypothetical protein